MEGSGTQQGMSGLWKVVEHSRECQGCGRYWNTAVNVRAVEGSGTQQGMSGLWKVVEHSRECQGCGR